MELTEPAHNTCLRHDYTANLQLISRPLCVENKELKDKNELYNKTSDNYR